MAARSLDDREIDRTSSKRFTRLYLIGFGIAALIGLVIGVVWVIAGLLRFHPIW